MGCVGICSESQDLFDLCVETLTMFIMSNITLWMSLMCPPVNSHQTYQELRCQRRSEKSFAVFLIIIKVLKNLQPKIGTIFAVFCK